MLLDLWMFLKTTSVTLDLSDWVTALATIVLTILTGIYVNLTGKILSSQTDPCVILTVVHDEDRPTMLQLVAKNVGAGLARDIRFEFSHQLPAQAWGIDRQQAKTPKQMTDGPFINGIPALGPGESRKMDWGQYGGLAKAIGDKKIKATCRFKKGRKEMPPINCPLGVESYYQTVASAPPAVNTVKELEKVNRNLKHLATTIANMQIQVVTPPVEEELN